MARTGHRRRAGSVAAVLVGTALLGGCHSDTAPGPVASAPGPAPLTAQQQQAMAQQGQQAAAQRQQGEAAAQQHGSSTAPGQ